MKNTYTDVYIYQYMYIEKNKEYTYIRREQRCVCIHICNDGFIYTRARRKFLVTFFPTRRVALRQDVDRNLEAKEKCMQEIILTTSFSHPHFFFLFRRKRLCRHRPVFTLVVLDKTPFLSQTFLYTYIYFNSTIDELKK